MVTLGLASARGLSLAAMNVGYSLVAMQVLLILAASHVATDSGALRLSHRSVETQYLWHMGLAAPRHVKSFQTKDLNLCPLHWQAECQLLDHMGSPQGNF